MKSQIILFVSSMSLLGFAEDFTEEDTGLTERVRENRTAIAVVKVRENLGTSQDCSETAHTHNSDTHTHTQTHRHTHTDIK